MMDVVGSAFFIPLVRDILGAAGWLTSSMGAAVCLTGLSGAAGYMFHVAIPLGNGSKIGKWDPSLYCQRW